MSSESKYIYRGAIVQKMSNIKVIDKVKLYEISDIKSGGTPSREKKEYWSNGEIPWVKIGDFNGKYIDIVEETITYEGLKNSSAKMIEKGSILFTIFATIGEVAILKFDVTTNQAIAGITVTDSRVEKEYLYYYLKSIKTNINNKGRGVAQNNINLSILKNLEVPIVSLKSQKNIVSILNRIDYIIESRIKQLNKINELTKSLFIEMFGDLGEDIFGDGLKLLKDVCQINPKKYNHIANIKDFLVSFVPMSAVSESGEIDTTIIKHYNEVKKGFTSFVEDDVLFAKITPCMENGKGAIAKKLKNSVGFGSTEFHILRPLKDKSNSAWIYYLTSFYHFRKEAEIKMTGSAGQRRVPASFLENYKIALPPIELQNKFADYVSSIDKSKLAVKKSLEELEILKKSLMQKYFAQCVFIKILCGIHDF